MSAYIISAFWPHIACFDERKMIVCSCLYFEREGDSNYSLVQTFLNFLVFFSNFFGLIGFDLYYIGLVISCCFI